MRFVPIDQVAEPTEDKQLTFRPIEATEPQPAKSFADNMVDAKNQILDGLADNVLPGKTGLILDAVRGRVKPQSGSVLEGVQLKDPGFNAAEAERLSRRSYAEANDPANPVNKAPVVRAATDSQAIPENGIMASAGRQVESFARSTAAGGAKLLSDVTGVAGPNSVSDALDASARGNSRIARNLDTGTAMRTEINAADPTRSGLQNFGDKYLPQIVAQVPQLAIAISTGGITVPAVMQGLSSYQDAREKGLSPVDAAKYATAMGGFEALGEKVGGTGKLADAFEKALASGFSKNAVRDLGGAAVSTGLREIPSEEATYVGQVATDNYFGVNPTDTLQEFGQGALDTAIVSAGTGGALGTAGAAASRLAGSGRQTMSAEELAKSKGFLRTFADPSGPASQAGITPVTVAIKPAGAPSVSTTDSSAGLAAGPGVSGGNSGIPSVGDTGRVDGALGGGVGNAAQAPAPSVSTDPSVPSGTSEQNAGVAPTESASAAINPVANPLKKTSDSDLLSKVPQEREPAQIVLGDDGTGYATEDDAKRVASAYQQRNSDIEWAPERLDTGRFRVAGYAPQGGTNVRTSTTKNALPDTATAGDRGSNGVETSQPNGREGVQPVSAGKVAQDESRDLARQEAITSLKLDREQYLSQGKTAQERQILAERWPEAKLDNPAPELEPQLNEIASGISEAYSVDRNRIQFYSDNSPGAANGFTYRGTAWVNTRGLSSDATQTAGHEGHHILEQLAKADDQAGKTNTPAQRYVKKVSTIFDGMSDKGKKAYIDNFLYKEELDAIEKKAIASGKTAAEARVLRQQEVNKRLNTSLTKSEMVADFAGNRFNDKKFLEQLAKADPNGFKSLVQRWIKVLDDLIASLRGNGKNKESNAVDSYVTNLKKARQTFAEALIELKQGGVDTGDAATNSVAEPSNQNRQGVYAEVAPDPRRKVPMADTIADEWNDLSAVDKAKTTKEVMDALFANVQRMMGLDGWNAEYTTGMFKGGVNPSVFLSAPEGVAPEQLNEVARVMGYLLDQMGMVAFDENNTTSDSQFSFVKVVLPEGMNQERIDQVRLAIAKAVPQANGDSLREGALVFGNFSAYDSDVKTLTDEQFRDAIFDVVNQMPEDFEVTAPKKFHSEYMQGSWGPVYKPTNRNKYLEGTRYASNQEGTETRGDDLRGRSGGGDLAQLRRLAESTDKKLRKYTDYYRANPTPRPSSGNLEGVGKAEREYGSAREGAVSRVGVHFSQQRRNTLSSAFHGTGLKGAERDRMAMPGAIKDRLYFYVDKGTGVVPEAGVGGVKHTIKLNNLYDINKDEYGFKKAASNPDPLQFANNWERMVRDAGFDGWTADNGGNQAFAVLLGKHDISMSAPSFQRRESIGDINSLGNFNLDVSDVSFDDFDLDFTDKIEAKEISMEDFINAKTEGIAMSEAEKRAELQAEIAREEQILRNRLAERAKAVALPNPREITAEQMQEHGLFPEKAMPFGKDSEDESGFVNIVVPRTYADSGQHEIEVIPTGNGYRGQVGYGISFVESRNAMSYSEIVRFTKAQLAAPLIHDSGFDITSAYRKGTALKIAQKWKELAKAKGVFSLPGKSVNKQFEYVARELKAFAGYTVSMDVFGEGFNVSFLDKSTSRSYEAQVELRRGYMECCTMNLAGSKGLGTEFYAVASEWARVNGYKFKSAETLSSINTARRTEQALSYSLKTGETGIIMPGSQNRVYGYNEDPKTQEDHDMNIARLALANMRNMLELDPDFSRLRYDPETGRFSLQGGKDGEPWVKEFLAKQDVRAYGVGRSTLARAALTNQIIRDEIDVDAIEQFAVPVAYQKRERGMESSLSEGWGGKDAVNPNFVKWFDGSKVVDEDGLPKVMYHGTTRSFEEFAPGTGYFTAIPDEANMYGGMNTAGANVVPAFLTIKSPRVIESESMRGTPRDVIADALSDRDIDGVIVTEGGKVRWAVPVDRGQIKSVFNSGSWSEEDPRISFQKREPSSPLESYIDQRNKSMPLVSTQSAQMADIELAVKAIEAASEDIASGSRDVLPIPIGRVPHVLTMMGASSQMLRVDSSIVRKVFFEKHSKEFPNITPRDLVNAIYNPAMVLRADDPNEFELVLPITSALKGVVIVPIVQSKPVGTPSVGGKVGVKSSAIKSIYVRPVGGDGNTIFNRIKNGRVMYADPALTQIAVTGRAEVSAASEGIDKRGAQFPVSPPSAQQLGSSALTGGSEDSGRTSRINEWEARFSDAPRLAGPAFNVANAELAVKPLNPNFVGWDRVRPIIMGGISERKIKSDVDLLKWIGNRYDPASSPDGWADAPAFQKREGEKVYTHEVIDPRDGNKVVGKYQSAEAARRGRDRLDNQYGGYRYRVRKIEDGLPMLQARQIQRAKGLEDETWFERQRRRFQDQFIQIRNLQDTLLANGGTVNEEQDVYGAEERMHGRTQELLTDFANNQIEPFIKKAASMKVGLDEISLYAYAKHAEERNQHIDSINPKLNGEGSGMSNVEAQNIIQMVKLAGDEAKFEELHKDLMGITSTTRRVLLDEGLITQDEYDGWENLYENYVPLRGFEQVDEDGAKTGMLRVGRGFSTTGKESIKALGRKSKAGEIIENIIRDYERAVIRSERNQVSKTFLDLALNNPDPDLWEVQPTKRTPAFDKKRGLVLMRSSRDTGEDTINIKVAGQDVRVKIHDPLILRAMKLAAKDETSQLERILAATLGTYTTLMRNTLTRYNPIFGALNAVRDAQMGAVSAYDALGAKGAALYAKYLGPSLAASFRKERGKPDPANKVMDKWIMEMRFAGGTTGGYYLRDTSEITETMRDMMLAAGAAPKGIKESLRASKAYQAGSIALRWLEIIGSTSEDAARAAAYRAAREVGKTPAEAASIAKNLTTNFNRKGEWGGTLNQLFLFFNAGVQGSARILQALGNRRVQYMMAGATAAAMTLALMNAGMGDDDDGEAYWDKIPDFEKERNLIFMLPPGVEMDGSHVVGKNGRYVKIPMAYGINVFAVLGNALADSARWAKDRNRGASPAKSGVRLTSAVFGSINPFGGSLDPTDPIQLSMAAAPTAIDFAIQMGAGVNAFGRPVGPEKSPFDEKPDSENFSARQAGTASQHVARWLNSVTGGNQARSGAIDVMPGTLDNLVRNATGGLGVFLADTFVNLPTKVMSPIETTTRDIPLARNFYGQIDDITEMGLFYERRAEVTKELKAAEAEMKAGIEVDYTEEQMAKLSLAKAAESYTKFYAKLKKREIEIAEDESMTRAEKMVARKEIEKQRGDLARAFNETYVGQMRDVKK
ncbi:LPD38 domain-containing protein [Rhodoferax mekongensis]|uniref:LPD38 domain-containing protein n=1 Tax=Rhodoferax mekongensis TaxID=3068341 RepID=A0ABZ0B4Q3_9BURK|nr:LPD38 domain-containing protein [Rhodoferax sp. TBRC 17307]WNO06064.1 LPD38 domain-containing protein [Rhodoferax sp. TBRC 17307]